MNNKLSTYLDYNKIYKKSQEIEFKQDLERMYKKIEDTYCEIFSFLQKDYKYTPTNEEIETYELMEYV